MSGWGTLLLGTMLPVSLGIGRAADVSEYEAMTMEPQPGTFPSWRTYWNFAHSVSRQRRYVHSDETKSFLDAVLETSESRSATILPGSLFWRAQLGHDWRAIDELGEKIPCAYSAARMKPLPDRAWDGRANPRGIPCLYVADSKEVAMSEVRPWVGSYISVGQFRVDRELSVIDCARGQTSTPLYLDEPEPEEREKAVWNHIDKAFAEPMTRSDDQADYVPTQILAELFKAEGYDGVVYGSNFGKPGYNLALFDPDVARLLNCGLFKVKSMSPEFSQADDFYYMRP